MGGTLFIEYFSTNPQYFFAVVISVIISITLHELAHGWMAIRLGDNTPFDSGHMTLNPLVHMGVMSLILLAMVGIAFGSMPIDPTRLRGKYAEAKVAAAGPAMNLVLGIAAIVALGLWLRFGTIPQENTPGANGMLLLEQMGTLNIALLIFNLIPVPPLDGSHILANFSRRYRRLLSSELAQGAATAIFFALFLGAGYFIFRAADYVMMWIIVWVVSVGR
ncbi:MAG: site-2 protease family protein [Burkholderiales bacterium]|nr:site-2 protease family protein [Phycisphaerae bacterium]